MGGTAAAGLIDPGARGTGIHAVHFYLDGDHFRLMASRFLAEGYVAGARVHYYLPAHLERMVMLAAEDLGAGARRTIAPLASAWRAPQSVAAIERRIRTAYRAALATGSRGLRLLIDCPSMAPHFRAWQRLEGLCDRLCHELPIVILCVFPLIREYEQVRSEIWAHHPYHYREGRFWPAATGAHAPRPGRLVSATGLEVGVPDSRERWAGAEDGGKSVDESEEWNLRRRIEGLRADLRREIAECGSHTDRRVVAAAARLEAAVLQWLHRLTSGGDIAVGEGRE